MTTPAAVADRAVVLTEIAGVSVAAHFGAPDEEYRAARRECALTHRPWRTTVRVTGADRTKFLQGLLSNDLAKVAPGAGCRALFLDIKGHVRSDLDIWIEPDAVVIGCDVAFVERVLPDLQRYVLGAAVEMESRLPLEVVLAVVGPKANDLLVAAGLQPPESTHRAHTTATLAGAAVRLARTPALGAPGVEVHVAADAADAAWRALETGDVAPAAYVGWDTSEILRVEAGWPAIDREITGDQFPQEAAMDDAVDYEKGCYLGQETVARIHYRGQVNRRLVGLRFGAPSVAGAELLFDQKRVGQATTTVQSPVFGAIGLGYVRRREADAEAALDVHVDGAAAGSANVQPLPFAE